MQEVNKSGNLMLELEVAKAEWKTPKIVVLNVGVTMTGSLPMAENNNAGTPSG